jgi:hypothetical protein
LLRGIGLNSSIPSCQEFVFSLKALFISVVEKRKRQMSYKICENRVKLLTFYSHQYLSFLEKPFLSVVERIKG